jgi:HSP20 family molecular chaperone IbpA
MSLFDDDPFEEIVREFFGGTPKRKREEFIKGEEEDRVIDFVEDTDYVYVVFELPGYNEKDIFVTVKGNNLEIRAQKSSDEKVQDYLSKKLKQGIYLKKQLPNFVSNKNFNYTMKNGVLEVVFLKTGRRK